MTIRRMILFALLFGAPFFGGCVQRTIVAEVLQQPLDGVVSTKYNLWYTDPAHIDSLNPQSGRILPVGTPVEPVYADETKLTFRDIKTNTVYNIDFNAAQRLAPMREFVRQTLTLQSREELLKDAALAVKERILRGEVVKGMTRAEVLLAYGPPPPIRTPDQKMTTWTYYIDKDKTLRVVFRGDRVSELFTVSHR